MLSIESIRSSEDRRIEKVFVPEWAPSGAKKPESFVYVRSMSGDERDAWDKAGAALADKKHPKNVRALLVVTTTCNQKGELIFTRGDVEWIGKKNAAALTRIVEVASRLSGITEADVEELEKN